MHVFYVIALYHALIIFPTVSLFSLFHLLCHKFEACQMVWWMHGESWLYGVNRNKNMKAVAVISMCRPSVLPLCFENPALWGFILCQSEITVFVFHLHHVTLTRVICHFMLCSGLQARVDSSHTDCENLIWNFSSCLNFASGCLDLPKLQIGHVSHSVL